MYFSKSLKLFSLLLIISFSLQAQSKRSTAAKVSKDQTEWMKTELELDDAQIQKIDKINIKYSEKIEEAMNQNKWNPDAETAELEAIKKDKYQELKKVLSDGQWKTYERNKLKKEKTKRKRDKEIQ